jgi:hypothetical protein
MRPGCFNMISTNPSSQGTSPSVFGKIGLMLFGLMFLGMGLLFTGFFLNLVVMHYSSRTWEETPCTITESRVDAVSGGYAISLAYQYDWKGRTYTSRLLKPGGAGIEKSVSKADDWAAKYPEGADAFCYVNPGESGRSSAQAGTGGKSFLSLIPLAFMLAGLSGIAAMFRKKPDVSGRPSSCFFARDFFYQFRIDGVEAQSFLCRQGDR